MVVDYKLNLNPKRLITFERKYLKYLKQEMRTARRSGEIDYVVWLNNRLLWTEKMVDKKVKKLVRSLNK